MKIPGVTFSLKRAIGVTKVKQKIAKATGIPLTLRHWGCSSSPVFEYRDVHIPTINSASGDANTHNRRISKIRRNAFFALPL